MTNLEKAVNVLVYDYEMTIKGEYYNWDIHSWSDMVEAFGQDSKDIKEDVIYTLRGADIYLNDDCELEEQDGTTISYRKLMNEVRKEMKKRVFK